ncbi:MAG: hypothetical protein JJU06_07920 [Ectothiorhodospiraceae bacterium]|nr:hypothetical protein [Ectothiorhodospiraceae bacterium]
MADWVLEEREKLLKYDTWATLKANAVVMVVLGALLVAGFLISNALGLDRTMVATVLMLLAFLVIPAVGLVMLDWLRTRFWIWSVGGHMRRLRATRYLSHYVELIGRSRLGQLPEPIRQRVDKALDREEQGYLPPEQDYARALQVVLQLPPKQPGEDGKKRRWPGAARWKR